MRYLYLMSVELSIHIIKTMKIFNFSLVDSKPTPVHFMSNTSLHYTEPALFNPFDNQKKSTTAVSGLLMSAIGMHLGVAAYLLSPAPEQTKTEAVIMEVALMPAAKPAAPPPQVKKEPEKPKPVVKPKPIKKQEIIKKPDPAPVIKEAVPTPTYTPPVTAQAPTTAPKAIGPTSDKPTVSSSVVALFRVPPEYPGRAANRHIQGWVTVEFTVERDGSVEDAVVVEAEPADIFDDAALTAIRKWRFKEKIVDGVPVTQRAVQKLTFKLEQ